MNIKELKELINNYPDNTELLVSHPQGGYVALQGVVELKKEDFCYNKKMSNNLLYFSPSKTNSVTDFQGYTTKREYSNIITRQNAYYGWNDSIIPENTL
jgi:hypothetical protein